MAQVAALVKKKGNFAQKVKHSKVLYTITYTIIVVLWAVNICLLTYTNTVSRTQWHTCTKTSRLVIMLNSASLSVRYYFIQVAHVTSVQLPLFTASAHMAMRDTLQYDILLAVFTRLRIFVTFTIPRLPWRNAASYVSLNTSRIIHDRCCTAAFAFAAPLHSSSLRYMSKHFNLEPRISVLHKTH